MTLLALVKLNHILRVDWQTLVWVDDNAEKPGVSLRHIAGKHTSINITTDKKPHVTS